jgi:hypothetical protein
MKNIKLNKIRQNIKKLKKINLSNKKNIYEKKIEEKDLKDFVFIFQDGLDPSFGYTFGSGLNDLIEILSNYSSGIYEFIYNRYDIEDKEDITLDMVNSYIKASRDFRNQDDYSDPCYYLFSNFNDIYTSDWYNNLTVEDSTAEDVESVMAHFDKNKAKEFIDLYWNEGTLLSKFKNRNLSRIVDGNDEVVNADTYESYVSYVINNDNDSSIMVYDDSNNLLDESYGDIDGMDNLNYKNYDYLITYLREEFPDVEKFVITVE